MTIEDMVQHLANITFVFDHHEKLGTTKSALLVREFQRCEDELVKELTKKEKELEARSSKS